MPIVRHHAKWLSLLKRCGPFPSVQVLLMVFPQGLDEDAPAIHRAWVRCVPEQTLQLPGKVLLEAQAVSPGRLIEDGVPV